MCLLKATVEEVVSAHVHTPLTPPNLVAPDITEFTSHALAHSHGQAAVRTLSIPTTIFGWPWKPPAARSWSARSARPDRTTPAKVGGGADAASRDGFSGRRLSEVGVLSFSRLQRER